jgi:hypothetical protein
MRDEFFEGVIDGRYVFLERAWGVTSHWNGALVVFRSRGDKFGVVSKSSTAWRCYLGRCEPNGMYGRTWWQELHESIVEGLDDGLAKIHAFLTNPED